jgi:hypothetical protein
MLKLLSLYYELGVFGVPISTKEATLKFFKIELSLFKKTVILANVFNPYFNLVGRT